MFSSTLIALGLASSAFATVFVTAPIASTSWAAGTPQTVTWIDDNAAPLLANFGMASVAICTGNSQQQTCLQTLSAAVDVSTTAAIQFTPDATMGASGSYYFLKFISANMKDATNPTYPAMAFSAKFALTGMTGTFNASVQSEIDGTSTAPIGGGSATTAAAASTTAAAATTTTKAASASKSATGSAKAAAASSSTSASANGASTLALSGAVGVAGVALALFGGAF